MRGRDYCCQIRETINNLRRRGVEPRAVWVGTQGAVCMRALWKDAATGQNGQPWDGVLPKYIAGIPCREGMTGGQDYVIEYFETDEQAHVARVVKDVMFKVSDNPLFGTH